MVISCYLVPENSPWSNTTDFYSHLISQIYTNSDIDGIYIAGDFNSRIGESQDVIQHVDELPPRIVIDDKTNLYRSHFLDFVKNTQFCVLNGRVPPLPPPPNIMISIISVEEISLL